jgi:molecular chaperone GrpE
MEENTMPVNDNAPFDINADADIPGKTHLSNPDNEDGDSYAKSLLSDLEDQKDKYLRLFAEFDNYKRRTAREKAELNQTAGKDIIISMLEILDDMDRAEKQMEDSNDTDEIKEGVKLVFNKLRNTLQQRGLTAMTSVGSDFDVEKHEAISEIESGNKMKGKVVDELEKGYYLNNKIIRFARVVVGK